jgi:hypothetical protein
MSQDSPPRSPPTRQEPVRLLVWTAVSALGRPQSRLRHRRPRSRTSRPLPSTSNPTRFPWYPDRRRRQAIRQRTTKPGAHRCRGSRRAMRARPKAQWGSRPGASPRCAPGEVTGGPVGEPPEPPRPSAVDVGARSTSRTDRRGGISPRARRCRGCRSGTHAPRLRPEASRRRPPRLAHRTPPGTVGPSGSRRTQPHDVHQRARRPPRHVARPRTRCS